MIQTQYEIDGNWSSNEYGDTVVQSIADETNAVLDVIGQSYESRDIYRLTIGTGDRLLIVTGGVHRSEPASREMVLMKARDVCYNSNGNYTSYLNNHKIMFIPTVSPDVETRNNAQGLNINRDAYALETPEMQALMEVMAVEHPDIYVDFHERGGAAQDQVEFIDVMNLDPNSSSYVRNASTNMISFIESELNNDGYATAPYPQGIIGPGMTISAAGLMGSVTMTPETYIEAEPQFRIDALGHVFEDVLNWHTQNESLIDDVRANYQIKPKDTYTLLNGDNEYYRNATELEITTPQGYSVTGDFSLWEGVYNFSNNGGITVEQHAGRLLPHLLETDSDMAVVEATRIEPQENEGGRWTKVLYDKWEDVFVKYY